MRYGLDIAQDGALDFVALGALVYRLDPGVVLFRKAVGEPLVEGLHTRRVARSTSRAVSSTSLRICDGVTGPNMATVYSDRGRGVRAPVVFYNTANEAAAQLEPGDFDWDSIFAGGVRWFHSGGIFAVLSGTTQAS